VSDHSNPLEPGTQAPDRSTPEQFVKLSDVRGWKLQALGASL
jgi:hypothetical protein